LGFLTKFRYILLQLLRQLLPARMIQRIFMTREPVTRGGIVKIRRSLEARGAGNFLEPEAISDPFIKWVDWPGKHGEKQYKCMRKWGTHVPTDVMLRHTAASACCTTPRLLRGAMSPIQCDVAS
jgi:hypothetical protein